jgi:hypothetical protein
MAREAKWRAVVEGRVRSVEPLMRYCARVGVSTSSFYRWRRQLRETPRGKPRFVPVTVVEPPAASSAVESIATPMTTGVRVVLSGGVQLELARGFCPATLRAAVSALEGLK